MVVSLRILSQARILEFVFVALVNHDSRDLKQQHCRYVRISRASYRILATSRVLVLSEVRIGPVRNQRPHV